MYQELKAKLFILFYYIRAKYGRFFSNRARLLRWQDKKIRALIQRLPYDNFYRQRLPAEKDFNDWPSWPLIDKQLMMHHFDELNTVGIKKEEAFTLVIESEKNRHILPKIQEITVGLSSGTSGFRGLFIVSPKERYEWVGVMLAKILPHSIVKPQKIALFLRANSTLYERMNNGTIQFCFFDMIKPITDHVEQLHSFNPDILIAPASVLRQLATLRNQHKLSIDVKKIYSTAEVLDPIDKSYIQTSFEQPIGQIYQATEGFLGITCAKGTLHLNEDLLHIEKAYLDKTTGKFNPIITDFSRTSQPILRYKLNDILTESLKPCACGSVNTAIKMIEGRCDDLVTLFHSDSTSKNPSYTTIYPDYIRQALLISVNELEEYLVWHHALGALHIAIRCKPSKVDPLVSQHQICQALEQMALTHEAQAPIITFIDYPLMDPTQLKKLRRIVRTY